MDHSSKDNEIDAKLVDPELKEFVRLDDGAEIRVFVQVDVPRAKLRRRKVGRPTRFDKRTIPDREKVDDKLELLCERIQSITHGKCKVFRFANAVATVVNAQQLRDIVALDDVRAVSIDTLRGEPPTLES